MNKLQENDKTYLAGFVDGDGSIIAQLICRKDYKHKYQIRVTFQVTQQKKRRWFLEKLQELVGAGYIRDRANVSDYIIVEPLNVANLLKQIAPVLKLKQKQANLVLKIIEQLPSSKDSQDKFLELCALVDQVAALNDTKKRKNTATTVLATLTQLTQSI